MITSYSSLVWYNVTHEVINVVEKHQIYIPCFGDMRTLHIYTPDAYATSNKRFPVLYMYDGHNLFYDEDATFGKCWGLKRYLEVQNIPLIVVGIECNHEGYKRLEEFSPYDFTDTNIGDIHGRGEALMQWVCDDLKKWIDRKYRTLPSRRHTGIAGSSMGGLMALYTICHHNETFSKAACLSPFLFGLKKEVDQEIVHASLSKDTHIYVSWGSDEFRSKNQLAKASIRLLEITRMLEHHQVHVYPNMIFKGRHAEESWEKELPICIPFLFP